MKNIYTYNELRTHKLAPCVISVQKYREGAIEKKGNRKKDFSHDGFNGIFFMMTHPHPPPPLTAPLAVFCEPRTWLHHGQICGEPATCRLAPPSGLCPPSRDPRVLHGFRTLAGCAEGWGGVCSSSCCVEQRDEGNELCQFLVSQTAQSLSAPRHTRKSPKFDRRRNVCEKKKSAPSPLAAPVHINPRK